MKLNDVEIAQLRNAARKGDPDVEFQKFLLVLNKLLDERSGKIYISQETLERIQKYGVESKLSWRGLLHSIFGRVLGESLGKERDESGRMIHLGQEPSRKTATRHRAVF